MAQWQRVTGSAAVQLSLAAVTYASVIAVAILVTTTAADRLIATWFRDDPVVNSASSTRPETTKPEPTKPTQTAVLVRRGSMIPTNDEWADRLRDPSFWQKNKSSGKSNSWSPPTWSQPSQQKSKLGGPAPAPAAVIVVPRGKSKVIEVKEQDDEENEDDTYRTVCVRLCDGSFFPLSFSTTRENFDADAQRCDKTCAGSRMFFYKNPGANLEDMEDQKGQPYKKLPTAFLYRTTYDASCKCRAHPWEETARTQHRVYALEAQKAKGDKTAAAELTDLKNKIATAEREAAAEKKRADLAKIAAQKKLADDAKAAKALAREAARAGTSGGTRVAEQKPSGDAATQSMQIKGNAAASFNAASASTANLWGPKQISMPVAPATPTSTTSVTLVPRTTTYTRVPDIRQSRMGLGAR